MAAGDVTLSGAFTINNATSRANIKTFMEGIVPTLSGGTFIVLPDINNADFWLAGIEG